MNPNSETSTNSMKFTPMPMSALLKLMPVKPAESPESKNTTADESDSSIADTVAKRVSPAKDKKLSLFSSTPKAQQSNVRNFVSEKKCPNRENNKESCNDQSMSNWTYPHKESNSQQIASVNKVTHVNTNNELDKLNVLTPHNAQKTKQSESVRKKTPELMKIPCSNQKKSATPKIKSGIRKFTPGSGRRSNRKTPQKQSILDNNKESVRCLFPDNPQKAEAPCPLGPPAPVPHTPMNKKTVPYAATPSYPQGMVKDQSKVIFKTTVIKGKKYMYIKKLGTGGSSEVYKVLEVGTSCEYAVKCVSLGADPELARGYVNEVRLLRDLQDSDRVIRLYNYEYDRENKFLRVVLEVGETDLSSFLKARGAGLPPALVLHYWEEMLQAVRHIHDHGVIHADLKPANFLLVCGRLKLIDFGIASSIASDATSVVRSQATGTYSYISPEALMGGAGGYGVAAGENAPIKISFKSDVWSLGCILYSMVYGRTPFGHIPNLAKLAAILDPNHRIHYPPVEHLPPSLISALKWCLTYNARSRPSVAELLAVPHLQLGRGSVPLPAALLDSLRPHVSADDFRLLQSAQLPT